MCYIPVSYIPVSYAPIFYMHISNFAISYSLYFYYDWSFLLSGCSYSYYFGPNVENRVFVC